MLGRRDLVVRNHEDLMKAIISGNVEAVEKLARTHDLKASNELIKQLKKRERAHSPGSNH